MSYKRAASGFTIIEMLVAMSIFMIVFAAATFMVRNGGIFASTVVASTEILEDVRATGSMISDGIARAVYVYPPGSQITLNPSRSEDAYSVRNPITNDNTWAIPSNVDLQPHPMLAYIAAPEIEEPNVLCGQHPTNPNIRPEACVTFVAYYAIMRSGFTSGFNYAADSRLIPTDADNPNAWMLMEYRAYIEVPALAEAIPPPGEYPVGTNLTITVAPNGLAGASDRLRGEVILDYIAPDTGFNVEVEYCQNHRRDDDLELCENDYPRPHFLTTTVSGNLTLNSEITVKRRPQSTGDLVFAISPKTLYPAPGRGN